MPPNWGWNHPGNRNFWYGYPGIGLYFGLGGYGWGYPGYYGGYYGGPGYAYADPGYYYPYGQPNIPPPSAVDPNAPPPAANTARLTVRVPADARVWVEDYLTQQTGPVRVMTTPALEPGQVYHYTVKAQWDENGQPVTREQTVNVMAGGNTPVDFTQPAARGG
jgi:uncharacterized protein (TIGR03000 family)